VPAIGSQLSKCCCAVVVSFVWVKEWTRAEHAAHFSLALYSYMFFSSYFFRGKKWEFKKKEGGGVSSLLGVS
jgi:hypothetical protein